MNNPVDTLLRSCACANLRQTDLVVTQFYDGMLAPSGLYALQFGLLSSLAHFAPITINRLAEITDMDRVTLSRHLKMLIDEDLVCTREGEDRSSGQILLTQEGEQALRRAWPLWQEAQERVGEAFGRDRFNRLLEELQAMRTALNSGAA